MGEEFDGYAGFVVTCPDEIVGEYYECGVFKEMTFKTALWHVLGKIPFPRTFAKYYSLDPIVQVVGLNFVPGHMKVCND